MTNSIIKKIYESLQAIGIKHPIYVVTIIFIPLGYIIYKNDLKRWVELDKYRKFHLVAGLICAVGLVLMSLLTLFGVFGD